MNGEDMATAKEHIAEVIKRQPDDSSYDDIVRELAFDLMVQRGLKDSDEQRVILNEEMERRIKSWQKKPGLASPKSGLQIFTTTSQKTILMPLRERSRIFTREGAATSYPSEDWLSI